MLVLLFLIIPSYFSYFFSVVSYFLLCSCAVPTTAQLIENIMNYGVQSTLTLASPYFGFSVVLPVTAPCLCIFKHELHSTIGLLTIYSGTSSSACSFHLENTPFVICSYFLFVRVFFCSLLYAVFYLRSRADCD